MTFNLFILTHRRIEGFDNLRDRDLCSLHMIEFARRHPEIGTQDEWLDTVRHEFGLSTRQFIDHPSRSKALQLWSLFEGWKLTKDRAPAYRPPRRSIGL